MCLRGRASRAVPPRPTIPRKTPRNHRNATRCRRCWHSPRCTIRFAAEKLWPRALDTGFDAGAPVVAPVTEFDQDEQFVLDEVLQLVAERAVAITGADGLAIALAENNEIVLRAAAGAVRPDVGARIDRDSAFSGACFRSAQIVMCDDTETDPRVNLQACRKLGARSMVAVPLCGRRRVIGVLEAFSEWPFGFNDSDVRNLSLLAELVLGALKPEDEDRFAQSAEAAATKLEPVSRPAKSTAAIGTCANRFCTDGSSACRSCTNHSGQATPAKIISPSIASAPIPTPTVPTPIAPTKIVPVKGRARETSALRQSNRRE